MSDQQSESFLEEIAEYASEHKLNQQVPPGGRQGIPLDPINAQRLPSWFKQLL